MPTTRQQERSDTPSGANEFYSELIDTRSALVECGRTITPFLRSVERNLKGIWTAEAIAERFLGGAWQAWLVRSDKDIVGLAATEIWQADNGEKVCSLRFVNGHNYKAWAHLIKDIEEWAKELGCVKVRNENAPGHMRRALKDYKVTHYVTEKVLSDGR